MQLVLVVPRLFAEPGAPASSRALARIVASSTVAREAQGIERALVDACGVAGVSAARATALARGEAADAASWLVADPVALAPGIDDVRVVARVDDVDAAESAALQATLNAHFAEDGMVLGGHGARWLARLGRPLVFDAPATSVVIGDSLWNRRPQGADARRVERFANEAQMLLHEHAVNRARVARGCSPVDGLWLWDAAAPAAAPAAGPPRRLDACAASSARDGLADIARGLAHATGGRSFELPPRYDALEAADADAVAVVVDAGLPFASLERDWLAPAVDALWRGARQRAGAPPRPPLARLTLIGDDARGVARVLDAVRPPLARRIAAYFAPPRLAWPP